MSPDASIAAILGLVTLLINFVTGQQFSLLLDKIPAFKSWNVAPEMKMLSVSALSGLIALALAVLEYLVLPSQLPKLDPGALALLGWVANFVATQFQYLRQR